MGDLLIGISQHLRRVEYLAPENFAMVEPGVYRSAFPRMKNAAFLKRLKLKSVVPLVPEEYPPALAEFYEANGIQLLSHGLDGNKWPFKNIEQIEFRKALIDILNPANRPVLIHCNKGKHRTGSLVGCLRKCRGWAMSSIAFEYMLFAAPKSRLEDQRFIENFDCVDLKHPTTTDNNQDMNMNEAAHADHVHSLPPQDIAAVADIER